MVHLVVLCTADMVIGLVVHNSCISARSTWKCRHANLLTVSTAVPNNKQVCKMLQIDIIAVVLKKL